MSPPPPARPGGFGNLRFRRHTSSRASGSGGITGHETSGRPLAEGPISSEPKIMEMPPLRVNQRGIAPEVTHAFDGKVAGQGILQYLVITSPNMDYVPEYPIERRVIETFVDGRWGVHEYSRWPQMLVPGMMHVACIPTTPRPPAAPEVLWADLHPSSSWKEDEQTGVSGLGFIVPEIAKPLADAAERILASLDTSKCTDDSVVVHAQALKVVLRQVLERMQLLPARPYMAVALAAHVQRLTLELLGVQTYTDVVQPRLGSVFNYELLVLPVVGAFVRDGSAAQMLTRAGIPTWFLQPMTNRVKVWRVVNVRTFSAYPGQERSQPPIHHAPAVLAGVANTTGNWLRTMAFSVSEGLCGSRLSALVQARADEDCRQSKRPRVAADPLPSKHITMPVPVPVPQRQSLTGKKTRRGGHKKKANAHDAAVDPGGQTGASRGAGSTDAPTSIPDRSLHTSAPTDRPEAHPSRTFTPSPFYSVPAVWADELRKVSPVPEPPQSTTYFFPPPFLLDTVAEPDLAPRLSAHPGLVRVDKKTARYVHNWVRIRRFCRARLFDPSTSNEPLTIAEWRAALWGDYQPRTERMKGAPSTDVRRAQRRQDERNGIARLFGRTALLASYNAALPARHEQREVTVYTAATDVRLRQQLLWECHEVNFRCELMALDTLLVHRPTWNPLDRWERESCVSGVWGNASSAVSVLPREDGVRTFCWESPRSPSWTRSREFLLRFLNVLRRWPDCPPALVANSQGDANWTVEEYTDVQRAAVAFYVETFAKVYRRLPVPPIDVPCLPELTSGS